jgi:hypothetical protein
MANSRTIAINKRILINRENDWKFLYPLLALFVPVALAAVATILLYIFLK